MAGPYYIRELKKITRSGAFNFENTDAEYGVVPVGSGIIDVVSEFSWSASPQSVRDKVTPIYLQERKLNINSLIATANYYINAPLKTGSEGREIKVNRALEKVKKFIQKGAFGTLSDSDEALINASQTLYSYLGIYNTSLENCFKYALPYFGKSLFSAKNAFEDNPQVNQGVYNLLTKGTGVIDEALETLNLATPGSFIERPKHFQFPSSGETVTVDFPLLNTIKHGNKLPYQQNYELLWILTYQNKPYRTAFSRILPPRIYTLQIPGQKFFPYCFISSMDVEFIGQRRNLNVTIPSIDGNSSNQVETVIPEAYKVSITFESLLADVGNTMLSPFFTNVVNVTRLPQIVSSPQSQESVLEPVRNAEGAIATTRNNFNLETLSTNPNLAGVRAPTPPLDGNSPPIPGIGGTPSILQVRGTQEDVLNFIQQ
jgi:hypothetical protein